MSTHTRRDMAGRVVGCETARSGPKSCGPLIRSQGGASHKNIFCVLQRVSLHSGCMNSIKPKTDDLLYVLRRSVSWFSLCHRNKYKVGLFDSQHRGQIKFQRMTFVKLRADLKAQTQKMTCLMQTQTNNTLMCLLKTPRHKQHNNVPI